MYLSIFLCVLIDVTYPVSCTVYSRKLLREIGEERRYGKRNEISRRNAIPKNPRVDFRSNLPETKANVEAAFKPLNTYYGHLISQPLHTVNAHVRDKLNPLGTHAQDLFSQSPLVANAHARDSFSYHEDMTRH